MQKERKKVVITEYSPDVTPEMIGAALLKIVEAIKSEVLES